MIGLVILQICTLGCPAPAAHLTPREAAVLKCFQEQPWRDDENIMLDFCLAKIPNAVWRQKR